jgi:hypothetical protein
MPQHCTCGALLPEDARFCHRCGKPQFEPAVDETPEIAAPAARAVQPAEAAAAAAYAENRAKVAFSNPLALRTCLVVASFVTAIEVIPIIQFVAPVLGGFGAVWLFQRRIGRALRIADAAKLGFMTALLNALFATIWMTLNFALAGSAIFDAVRDQLHKTAMSPAQQQALQMMNDPVVLAFFVLFVWIIFFVLASLLYMAGGALGARFARQPKES